MSNLPENTTQSRQAADELQRPEYLLTQEYNKIVEAAELQEIKLVKSSFVINPDYFSEDIQNKRIFSIDRKVSEPSYDAASEQLVAGFDYAVGVKVDEKHLLTCEASYIVVFSVEGEFDEEALKYYARRTGRSASYPYFRQYAASQSWASGADLPLLPFLKTNSGTKTKDAAGSKDGET
jgi:preprotein translocase subunit SecB